MFNWLRIIIENWEIIIYLLTFETSKRIRSWLWESKIWPVNVINSLQRIVLNRIQIFPLFLVKWSFCKYKMNSCFVYEVRISLEEA